MTTAGEYRIEKIVAVWRPEGTAEGPGALHVLAPCGVCRQFMLDVDLGNAETDVILGPDRVFKLKQLLPFHEWPDPV